MASKVAQLMLLLACSALIGCAMAQNNVPKNQWGYLAALNTTSHAMMMGMVSSNNMYKNLMAKATIAMTIFAPTDAAFQKAMKKYNIDPKAAMGNTNLFNNVLLYHVINGKALNLTSDIVLPKGSKSISMPVITMKQSMALNVTRYANGTYVVSGVGSKAKVGKKNQPVYNPNTGKQMGMIHDIDTVLLPSKNALSLI